MQKRQILVLQKIKNRTALTSFDHKIARQLSKTGHCAYRLKEGWSIKQNGNQVLIENNAGSEIQHIAEQITLNERSTGTRWINYTAEEVPIGPYLGMVTYDVAYDVDEWASTRDTPGGADLDVQDVQISELEIYDDNGHPLQPTRQHAAQAIDYFWRNIANDDHFVDRAIAKKAPELY